eukprot:6386994-Amphidinium_carterae.1
MDGHGRMQWPDGRCYDGESAAQSATSSTSRACWHAWSTTLFHVNASERLGIVTCTWWNQVQGRSEEWPGEVHLVRRLVIRAMSVLVNHRT